MARQVERRAAVGAEMKYRTRRRRQHQSLVQTPLEEAASQQQPSSAEATEQQTHHQERQLKRALSGCHRPQQAHAIRPTVPDYPYPWAPLAHCDRRLLRVEVQASPRACWPIPADAGNSRVPLALAETPCRSHNRQASYHLLPSCRHAHRCLRPGSWHSRPRREFHGHNQGTGSNVPGNHLPLPVLAHHGFGPH